MAGTGVSVTTGSIGNAAGVRRIRRCGSRQPAPSQTATVKPEPEKVN
ncbi:MULTISPECIES: hypothetical protein [Amycolatopsis]|nr:hypothetical protein [Amycolatopsis sacchari]